MNDSRSHKIGSEKESFAEKLNRALDIPPDILPGGSVIEIRGREAVSIGGSTSILLYTPTEIRLEMRSGKYTLAVRGERLVCATYNAREVRIDGHISSISFEEE